MNQFQTSELLAFIVYFIVVLGIGFFFMNKSSNNASGYFLGNRKMGSWVTALSAQASDMSGWLLMGLPGSVLALGLGQVWIAVGLAIGTYLNWLFTAKRLRRFSKAANDAITIPEYLGNRFMAASPVLRIVCAIVFFVCFAVYVASGFKAAGTLFSTVLGISLDTSILISAAIILVYTFTGGFNAVCWTDFFQGLLMLAALIAAPIAALFIMGGMDMGTFAATPNYFNILPTGKFDWESISTIISGLAWGLGYFGMPHILVRFMAIENSSMIKKSRRIAIVWVLIALAASVLVGMVGKGFLPGLGAGNEELVFIQMVRTIFPGFIAGILLSAILAASMSTADSQLLVASSSFTADIYKPIIHKKASDKEVLWVGRLTVVVVSVVAYFLAVNPNSGNIMDLVSNAWAGFGAAFGPVIILSLYWKRLTLKGAVAGIIGGGATVVLWLAFLTDKTGVYELLPGFIVGLLLTFIVSFIDKKPSKEIEDLFDRALDTSIDD